MLANITAATSAPQVIEVNFADNVDLDETTIDGDELQVKDSAGNSLAVSLSGVTGTTATYQVAAPGGDWDIADNGAYSVEVVASSVSDVKGNAIATTPLSTFNAAIPASNQVGAATFSVNLTSNNVQVSNFGNNSFKVTNVGGKKIAKVEFDATNALYPDTVFDPFGIAGDTVFKPLTIHTNGGTGVVAPSSASYIGTGRIAGYEGIELLFNESVSGGFEPGESLGFSVDMDPNSIAGAKKSTLDGGTNPSWDVGGVSGAELIDSTVTVTFADGTTATAQLQGAGNQAGAQALAAQNSPETPVSLTVSGLGAGENGTYDESGPSAIVNGTAGQTARVVLTKGFIQPGTNNFAKPYKSQLNAQLATLVASDFPANNAVEFQTVDILLTGANQDISSQFDFSNVSLFNLPGEDQLPLGFVAGIVDPQNSGLPTGPVTQPIYLQYLAAPGASFSTSISVSELVDELTGTSNGASVAPSVAPIDKSVSDDLCQGGMAQSDALSADTGVRGLPLFQNGSSFTEQTMQLASPTEGSSAEETQLTLGNNTAPSEAELDDFRSALGLTTLLSEIRVIFPTVV